jgi:hypothetical protein
MISHYDTVKWTPWFYNEFSYGAEVFWIVMAVVFGIPLGIISSPVWVPLGLLGLIGWGIYEIIVDIIDKYTYESRVKIYDYQLKVKYQEQNDYTYVLDDPNRHWRIYDDYFTSAKFVPDDIEL